MAKNWEVVEKSIQKAACTCSLVMHSIDEIMFQKGGNVYEIDDITQSDCLNI